MAKLAQQIEEFVAGLGFEVVTLDRGGGHGAPTLTLKIDRPYGEPGESEVTVGDCTRVARELRDWLEESPEAPRDWVLEVSSPGVERPLVRPRDYRRFAGREVEVKGYGPLAGGRKRLEGTLLGLVEEDGDRAALEVDGERVEVPLSGVASAKLVYDWESDL